MRTLELLLTDTSDLGIIKSVVTLDNDRICDVKDSPYSPLISAIKAMNKDIDDSIQATRKNKETIGN